MVRYFQISLLSVFFIVTPLLSLSQSFNGKGSKQVLVGLGATERFSWYPENGTGPKGRVSPLSGMVSCQVEFGIGKYVGLGFLAGVEFARNYSSSGVVVGPFVNSYGQDSFWSMGVPVALFSNFHFLQLIADKSDKNFAEKLDVYVGLSFGSGPVFAFPKSGYESYGSDIGFMIYGGPHVGLRFYPKNNVGVFVELGYGKSYVNGGVCFKM